MRKRKRTIRNGRASGQGKKNWQGAIDWRADNFDVVINSVISKHNDTQAHCQEDISIISSAVVSVVVVFFVLQPFQNSTSTATPLPQDYNFSNHISREMKKEKRRVRSKWLRGRAVVEIIAVPIPLKSASRRAACNGITSPIMIGHLLGTEYWWHWWVVAATH